MFVQEMAVEECRKALVRASFGRLACARENQPYVVPIYFAVDNDDIYSFSMHGQKIDWMRDNPHVCLEIDSVKKPERLDQHRCLWPVRGASRHSGLPASALARL